MKNYSLRFLLKVKGFYDGGRNAEHDENDIHDGQPDIKGGQGAKDKETIERRGDCASVSLSRQSLSESSFP